MSQYNSDQVIQIVLKVISELNKPDVTKLSVEEKKKLAEDENTPTETLILLAKDVDYWVRCWVAQNPNTPPETLTLLANDEGEDVAVLCDAAKHPNTPPETLTLLAKNVYPSVRFCVAHNPNTPPEALTLLASDDDYWVRCRVAKHPNYNPTETVPLTKQQKEAIQNLIESSQDENLKSIKL
jgi:hypothetical protein